MDYMNHMFEDASSFNQPLDNWEVSNVMEMRGMFENAESFNQPLNNWHVASKLFTNHESRWPTYRKVLNWWCVEVTSSGD